MSGIRIDNDTDEIIFSSGRRLYVHRGIVGIDQNLNLFEGYDGRISYPSLDFEKTQLAPEDMKELADLMIMTWINFRCDIK